MGKVKLREVKEPVWITQRTQLREHLSSRLTHSSAMASARTSLTSQRPLGKTKHLKRTMIWNQALGD